jgi:hypothetical protein
MKLAELSADDRLASLYYDIFTPAFPADQLGTLDAIRAGIRDGYTRVVTVIDDDGAVIAGAVAKWSESCRVLLLSYLAVADGDRGKGTGGQLYRHVRTEWMRAFRPCLFVAEVEHPDHHPGSSAHGDPLRRLRFYASHGARALGLPYFQPPLRPDAERVYGMLLLALHVDREVVGADPASVNGSPLRTWFTEYLVETEGTVSTDPATTAMMRAVTAPGGVPLVPAERYREVPVAFAATHLTDH